MTAQQIITQHLDIWTAAHKTRSSAGRGSSNKLDLYGIKKLRELILELAVRGKLVPQDANDEPASELLKKIAVEKENLIKEGKIKKEKTLSKQVEAESEFFDLPTGWQAVQLQLICSYIQRGKGPVYSDFGRVRVISQKCVQWSGFDIEQARYVNDDSLSAYQEERFLRTNDLLWNSTGTGTVGRITVLSEVEPNTLVADSHVTVIRPIGVNSRFLNAYISAPGIQMRIEPGSENALVSGTTNQVELNTSSVMGIAIPIPPLAEQHRIVAKVDELMAFCDQLEQTQSDNIAAHAQLVEALLATLTNSSDHNELQNNWQRIAAHFDTLFTTEHSIDQLKQTILQLAVMGKLVPQNPNDEPASELLKKIAAEKAQLIKEGKIKKEKPLPEITDEEKPFELPSGWEWVRLKQITSKITDGDHQTPPRIERGFRLLSAKNVRDGFLDFENCDYIAEDAYLKSRERCLPESGDLLIVSVGGTIGRSSVVPQDSDFALVRSVALIKPLLLYSEFLKYSMDSSLLQDSIHSRKRGGAQPCLYLSEISMFPFVLPPLAEQHRIVTKVDELMSLCDTLKTNLQNAQTTQLALADALVEQATV